MKKEEILYTLKTLVFQIQSDIAEENMSQHFYAAYKDALDIIDSDNGCNCARKK